MKILVDRKRCEGHGLCEDAAPSLFELDDEGELVLLFDGAVPEGQHRQAGDAVRVCPVSALKAQ